MTASLNLVSFTAPSQTGPSGLKTTDRSEEASTTPDSATAVMPTSSTCRASPRFSDHLEQGPTLMIVRLLPLGKILLAAQENKLLLQLESKLTSWPPSVRRPAGVRPVGSGRSCRPPIGPAPPRTIACLRPTVARRTSSDTQPRPPQETASEINGHSVS